VNGMPTAPLGATQVPVRVRWTPFALPSDRVQSASARPARVIASAGLNASCTGTWRAGRKATRAPLRVAILTAPSERPATQITAARPFGAIACAAWKPSGEL